MNFKLRINVSTKQNRRRAVYTIANMLNSIYKLEEQHLENIWKVCADREQCGNGCREECLDSEYLMDMLLEAVSVLSSEF